MLFLLLTACLADLRPDVILPEPQPDRDAAGRALLEAAAEASGGRDVWAAKSSAELVFTDDWFGMAQLFNPWPEAHVRVHLVQHPTTFDSRATFLGGSEDGTTWGVEDFAPYVLDDAGEPTPVDDGDIRFMLPTVQYFLDLPFRLPEAELVRAVGTEEVNGTVYDVVYATWGSIERNGDYDQYLVYVNPETHRIDKITYTVREVAPFVTGTCHLDDQRLVDGLWVPHRMTVTPEPTDPTDDGGMHVMVVETMRYDSLEPGTWTLRDGVAPLDLGQNAGM